MYQFILAFLTILVVPSSGSYCDYGLSVQGLGTVDGKDLNGDYLLLNGKVYEKGGFSNGIRVSYDGVQGGLMGWNFMDEVSKQKVAVCWDGCAEPVGIDRGIVGWDTGTVKTTTWRFAPNFMPGSVRQATITCLKNPNPPTPAPPPPPPVPCCRTGIRVEGLGTVESAALDGDYLFINGKVYEKGSFSNGIRVSYDGVEGGLMGWNFMNEIGKEKVAVCWDGCAEPVGLDRGIVGWDIGTVKTTTWRIAPKFLPGDEKKVRITCLNQISNTTLLV